MSAALIPPRGVKVSARSKLNSPVIEQRMPGLLFELLCRFLFFRRHGRFLLFFTVIFSFFSLDVYSG